MTTTDIAGLLLPRTPHRHTPTPISEVHGGQEYFEFDSPESFISPQLFAVNPSGNMIYSVKIDMKLTLDPDTQEVVIVVGSRFLCRCSIHTGQSTNYVIDYDISGDELRQSTDFYVLADNIAVLLTYNQENYHFSQHVLVLNDETRGALLTITRTTTLPSLSSGLTIGTGLLSEGYILLTGYNGPDETNRHVVALLIAADPYKASLLPNKDLSQMVMHFEQFLQRTFPNLRVFAPGIFAEKNGLIFMLRGIQYDVLETSLIGRAFQTLGEKVRCLILSVDNSSVLFARLLCVRHVRNLCHRNEHIWMTIISSDFAELSTWRWRFYLSALLYIIYYCACCGVELWSEIRKIVKSGNIIRLDRGISLYFYMKLLRWLYGPSMIPVTAPPPTFAMYGLNMRSLKFRRVPIQPKLYSMDNSFVSYPLAIDCDNTGGVVTAELGSSLKVTYFPSQISPPSLCKLAEHSVYRNFPAFEKSPLLRRSVGQLNWELL